MDKLTFEQIIEKFKEAEFCTEDILESSDSYSSLKEQMMNAIGEVPILVEEEGGHEGEGEDVSRVLHFPIHDVYILITGFYSSYVGTEWDKTMHQVFPRRVIQTVYETAETRGNKTDEV